MKPGRLSLMVVLPALAGYAVWLSSQARGSDTSSADAIGRITTAELCVLLSEGRRVVFVDVREPEEFAEEHIPNAVSMPVREMHARARPELRGSDLLVPYCLKDFRGFEGARRLVALGFPEVRLLEGLGIRGWKHDGLATAGNLVGKTDLEAWTEALGRCEALQP